MIQPTSARSSPRTRPTTYPTERHTYSNLWVIRLDADGRCAEFAEWWMRHPAPDGPAGLSDPP
jgi:hypothetical protein